MSFDNLTLVSLLIFLVAFGAFVYACLFRNCITNGADSARRSKDTDDHNRL